MTYGSRANAAAATATACGGQGCPSCVKTGLPVLLVRPGLADINYAKARQDRVKPLLKGVAEPPLVASGYVMRALRQGYLYAYYEKPHTPEIIQQKGWQVFHVDDGGYLTPMPLAAAGQQAKTFSCKRDASYAIAMLFVIPEAKSAGKVWVGFTDHPWSDKVRARYASDAILRDKRMSCIDATAGRAERSVPMSVLNVEECVADYKPGLRRIWPEALKGNPFQGHQRSDQSAVGEAPGRSNGSAAGSTSTTAKNANGNECVLDDDLPKQRREWGADLVREARKLIQSNSDKAYSEANLMIVSVPDPVGVTTEAAQRRITLCNSAAKWIATEKPNYLLQSALQIEGMLEIIEQNGKNRKAANATFANQQGRRVTRRQFDEMVQRGQLPRDAVFNHAVKKLSIRHYVPDPYNGTIDIPNEKQIDYETNDLKAEILSKLEHDKKGPKYKEFLKKYQARVEADTQLLAQFQKDYEAWLNSDARKLITQYDFDAKNHEDGVPYAECIVKITLGGPLTESGKKMFEPFLSADAANEESLLTRALLGNQETFFNWLTEVDQVSKGYDSIKTALDLDPVKQALQIAGTSAAAYRAREAVRQLLTVSSAVAAAKDQAGRITERFRYQLKLLTMAVMSKSETAPVTLVRISVTLGEATRMWHDMLGKLRQTAVSGERKIQSLLLDAAVAVELNGAPRTATAMTDVYLFVKGAPDAAFAQMKAAGVLAGRYVVQPAEIYGERLAKLAMKTDLTGASRLARQSFGVMTSGTTVLAAGAGFLQILLVGKAWKAYAQGSTEQRQAAALSLLSAGLGVAAASLEIAAAAPRQAGKKALAEGIKKTAATLAVVATAVDAVQAAISAGRAYSDGDNKAMLGHAIQFALFLGAAGAGAAAAFGSGSAVFLGLSATGWGLILVGIGVIIGFIVLLIKDKPPEKWAAKTIWGKASSKWRSFEEEAEEANKVLLGVEVEYSNRMNILRNLGASSAMAQGSGMAMLFNNAKPEPYTREAWLRMRMPTELAKKLPWELRIFAKSDAGDIMLGGVRHYGKGQTDELSDFKVAGVLDHKHETEEKGGVSTHTLSVTVDAGRLKSGWATVRIFADTDTTTSPDGDIAIVDEELRD